LYLNTITCIYTCDNTKSVFLQKLIFSYDINPSASEVPTNMSTPFVTPPCVISIGHPTSPPPSDIVMFRITAQHARANVQDHSIIVAIYKKINKKSNEGLTSLYWRRPISPETKHLLMQDGYKIGPTNYEGGFTISW